MITVGKTSTVKLINHETNNLKLKLNKILNKDFQYVKLHYQWQK